jgi:hypothetical protein
MEDRDRTTLAVAAAGIAATALVGIAGVVGAWLSARDDRQAQHSLAREERTYERRVAVYLDAIDFVEGQQNSLHTYADKFRERQFRERHGAQLYPSRERTFPREWGIQFGDVPYQHFPPPRLTTRLRAFGSSEVLDAFENAQALTLKMDIFLWPYLRAK